MSVFIFVYKKNVYTTSNEYKNICQQILKTCDALRTRLYLCEYPSAYLLSTFNPTTPSPDQCWEVALQSKTLNPLLILISFFFQHFFHLRCQVSSLLFPMCFDRILQQRASPPSSFNLITQTGICRILRQGTLSRFGITHTHSFNPHFTVPLIPSLSSWFDKSLKLLWLDLQFLTLSCAVHREQQRQVIVYIHLCLNWKTAGAERGEANRWSLRSVATVCRRPNVVKESDWLVVMDLCCPTVVSGRRRGR